MGDVSKCKVGDIVILTDYRREARKVPITRVGRTNIYITEYTREAAYDRTSGSSKSGSNSFLRTVEQYEADQRAANETKRMRAFGVELSYGVKTEKALAIAAALAPLMAEWEAAVGPSEGRGGL